MPTLLTPRKALPSNPSNFNSSIINKSQLINIRRSRGYSYEHTLVQKLNNCVWVARRLGGSSTGLPDIIAVNNKESTLLSIEAKSGTGDVLYVQPDQILRCLLIKDMFAYYKKRHVVLAFKFMRKKRFKRSHSTVYETRKLAEYYKIADALSLSKELPMVKCTYDGTIYVTSNGQFQKKSLPNYTMPFQNAGSYSGSEVVNPRP